MTTLMAVERIKLFTTRSPWWCMAIILVCGLGLATLSSAFANDQFPATPASAMGGLGLGSLVMMVLAVIAVTSEYRFGTIRATFAAAPNRTMVLVAKTIVLMLVGALIGLITAFASWGLAYLIDGSATIAIDSGGDWRAVAGNGLLYACYAVIAVGVGLLVRHTAGAIALLLLWSLIVESLIVGLVDGLLDWNTGAFLPFTNAGNFTTAGDDVASGAAAGAPVSDFPWGPWGSLLYFAGICVAFLIAGIVVANRRDA